MFVTAVTVRKIGEEFIRQFPDKPTVDIATVRSHGTPAAEELVHPAGKTSVVNGYRINNAWK
jgi:hypothetical protein